MSQRTKSNIFLSSIMILHGMLMVLYSLAGIIDLSKVTLLLEKVPYLSKLFFYPELPQNLIIYFLSVRLVLALLQIVVGIIFFEQKVWSLVLYRLIAVIAFVSTFFNPLYSYSLILLLTIPYIIIIYILFHSNIENNFKIVKGYEKSKGILIFACIETVIGMILLRTSLLSIPLDGFSLDVMTRMDFNLTLVVPKFASLFFSLMGSAEETIL